MNERQLRPNPVKTPVVKLTFLEGSYLVGKLLTHGKETKFGSVFEFSILDTNAKTFVDKTEVDVKEGERVSLFTNTRLTEDLRCAKLGETVKVVYEGKKTTKNGRICNAFKASVLEGV